MAWVLVQDGKAKVWFDRASITAVEDVTIEHGERIGHRLTRVWVGDRCHQFDLRAEDVLVKLDSRRNEAPAV